MIRRNVFLSNPAFCLGRWWAWWFPALFGALLGAPLAAAEPDQDLVSYDELVEYLGQPRGITRSPVPMKPADWLRITVPFDFDKAELTPLARQQLDLLAGALRDPAVGDRRIEMAGHCDERGTEEYNLRLSERRVESAVYYLSGGHQIAQQRVVGYGYGKSRPKIPNARTKPEHAANRRVEIRLLDGPPPAKIPAAESPVSRGVEPKVVSGGGRLAIEWGVLHTNGTRMQLIADDGTANLRSGDTYRIYVRPGATSYVYIYQIDSTGEGLWLFPSTHSLGSNPLSASDSWFPDPDRSFELAPLSDGRPIQEVIHLIASTVPVPELEELLAKSDAEPAAVISRFELGATRGQRVVPRLGGVRIESSDGSGRLQHKILFGHEAP